MDEELAKQTRSIANSSGFPLQLKVADIARSAANWEVYLEEHPWHSEETHSEGFIDLVLLRSYENTAMVVECKRVRQASWVFLIPREKFKERSHTRLWYTDRAASRWDHFGWLDIQAEPSSYESTFCAIPGNEQGRLTLLERTASDLITSLETLASQEREFQKNEAVGQAYFKRLYVAAIVTTAELRVASFEPSSISPGDGCLPADTICVNVPYVRFQKSLRTGTMLSQFSSAREAYQASERTVFVINAEHWAEFLDRWYI